jgi:hypothetical protein
MILPIKHNDNRDHSACWDDFAPIVDDDIAGDNFKGYERGLEDEEIIARGNTKRLVNVTTGETDKWRRNGKISHHFRHALGGVLV